MHAQRVGHSCLAASLKPAADCPNTPSLDTQWTKSSATLPHILGMDGFHVYGFSVCAYAFIWPHVFPDNVHAFLWPYWNTWFIRGRPWTQGDVRYSYSGSPTNFQIIQGVFHNLLLHFICQCCVRLKPPYIQPCQANCFSLNCLFLRYPDTQRIEG